MMVLTENCFLSVAPPGHLSTNGWRKTNLFFLLISITAQHNVTLACSLLPPCDRIMAVLSYKRLCIVDLSLVITYFKP